MKKLVRTLQKLNKDFGEGEIESVIINLLESKKKEWYGTVVRRLPSGISDGPRMFKVVKGICTFLSRRRKVT